MHIYAHPALYPVPLQPGTIVSHKYSTAPLVVVSGPHRTELHAETYIVRVDGKTVRVVRENLRV